MNNLTKLKTTMIIEKFFEKLALGSERYAKVDEFAFNEQTGDLKCKLRVISKEVMGVIGMEIPVYELTSENEFQINLYTPEKDSLLVRVTTPLGDIAGNMEGLVPILKDIIIAN